MSTPVKLASALPAEIDRNGLGAILRDLVDDPTGLRVLIAIVDTKELHTITDTGEVVPVARVRRIEALTGPDLGAGHQLFRRAHERRTGRVQLSIEDEDEIRDAFGMRGFQATLEAEQ